MVTDKTTEKNITSPIPASDSRDKGTSGSFKKIVSILSLSVFVCLSFVMLWFVGRPMLKFVEAPALFRAWIDSSGAWGRSAFVGMVALQVIFAIIPGEPLEMGAGYAFGFWEGTLLCMLGIAIGSSIVFFLTRKFGVRLVGAFFSEEKLRSLKFLQNTRRLEMLMFLLFFIPGTPKDILTYFAGLTPIKFRAWMLITLFARIPSIVTSTVGGDALGLKNYQFAIIVFSVTLAVSILGMLLYRHITKKRDAGLRPPRS